MKNSNWKWYQYNQGNWSESPESSELFATINMSTIKELKEKKTNFLKMENMDDRRSVLKGSLVYNQHFSNKNDYQIFHFCLTEDTLYTIDLDFSDFKNKHLEKMIKRAQSTKKPVDGLLLIIRELLSDYLIKIDEFEMELRELVWDIHERNKMSTLEKTYRRRHALLVWSNLLVPINELMMAMDEMYLDLNNSPIFIRTQKRLNRALHLLDVYQSKVDSIIKLEEVISSHRGNEIMKTLTVMTAIFTPAMAWGAIWGMNFKMMPELEWKYGYLLSIIIIGLSMVGVYFYLRMKGWTGDLLKGKKRGMFFK